MSIADRVVVMNHGRIEDEGAPDRVYLKPASLFAATFMGESNIIAGVVRERDGNGVRVETPLGLLAAPGLAEVGQTVSLSIRPDTLPVELQVTGRTETGLIMAVRHKDLPIEGVQFHPESVLTEGGHRMLANWLAGAGHEVPEELVRRLGDEVAALTAQV